jgi:4-aminobutyrate aminotransferase-like enzyme
VDKPETTAALLQRRQKLLGPAYRLFYEEPVHLVRGEGVWLFDPAGERYLDTYNNVASVGHCHPHVVDAIARQAARLNTHTRYLHKGVLDYAERLLATFPSEIGNIMFTCSGSEANDLALRVAETCTGGTGFIATANAYHGVTQTLAKLSPSLGLPIDPAAPIRLIPAPSGGKDADACFAAGVRTAIEEMRVHGIRPAALIVDTIFSSDGVFPDPPGFLQAAVAEIRAAGGLFIADEVQPGFGRTGDHMWGFQRHDLVPDLVTMGKPMGNGHPIAAMAAKPELLAEFGRRSRYFNTFGGNPVSVAAGMAVLDVIENEGILANAAAVGTYLQDSLQQLAARHPLITAVRGAGLFIGVELCRNGKPATQVTTCIVNALRKCRVLVGTAGPQGNILKIRPPLVFDRSHADFFMTALNQVLINLSLD